MKTVIYTSFPCLIKVNEIEETLSQNENLIIDENCEKLLVYPLQKGKISFEINLSIHENNFYRIIERGGKRLVFLIDGLYAENAEICEFKYQNIKSKVEVYPQKVVFSNSDCKKIIHLSEKYLSYKCGNIKFIDYCILENLDNGNTLIAYNAQKNTARVFNADEIKLDDEGFVLNSSAFGYTSISQHLYIDDEGLKIRKKDFISASSQLVPEETIPYQFLNSIKYGDYEKGLNMLAPQLNDRLNCESLKSYFGDISYFYMLNPNTAYAISNNQNVIYEFQVKDQKICEISSE